MTENDNWYEIYYPASRVSADDLASFVKANAHSTVRTLTRLSADLISHELAVQQKRAFFIDFFAPVIFKFAKIPSMNSILNSHFEQINKKCLNKIKFTKLYNFP